MEYLVNPWAHQLTAIERASSESMPWFALFFEMGAGKTMTAINILRAKMMAQRRYLRTLIFCPPIVVPNWKEEFCRHTRLDPHWIHLLQGHGQERLELFQEVVASGKPAFFVTNYESLLLGGGREKTGAKRYIPGPLFQAFQSWGPDALIFDESHRLKNYKAQRSKLAAHLANPRGLPKPLTYLLSGSPVLNSPLDLFHQFLILDGGATFGKNFVIFRARFFEDKNAGMLKNKSSAQRYFPDWVIKPGAVHLINQLIFQVGMRVTKAECMDLPEETSVTIKVGMTPEQTRHYREMKRDFLTFVDTQVASTNLAIVKALRLLQITSGFLPLDPQGQEADPAKVVYTKCPKEEALRELLEEIAPSAKVIVWAVWKENYAIIRRICEELGLGYVEVHGEISRSQQDENVEKFKTDPAARVFIGHPGSGGIGINLTCAPYSIFFSRTFSLEHWLQARARNHRGGQTEKVTHYDLVCDNTIDVLVQNKLANKFDMSESLLRDISSQVQAQRN